jgi:hypothetical protein
MGHVTFSHIVNIGWQKPNVVVKFLRAKNPNDMVITVDPAEHTVPVPPERRPSRSPRNSRHRPIVRPGHPQGEGRAPGGCVRARRTRPPPPAPATWTSRTASSAGHRPAPTFAPRCRSRPGPKRSGSGSSSFTPRGPSGTCQRRSTPPSRGRPRGCKRPRSMRASSRRVSTYTA